jgi:hypothetical protein
VWPLALALVIGVAIGFAGGYAFRLGERPPIQAAALDAGTAAAGVPAKEFTEGTIVEPKRPVGAAAQPSSPPRNAATTPALNAGRSAPAREAATPSAGDRVGRLLVRSSPAGARVFVDGRDAGRTPATIHDLTTGPHRVRVSREGYGSDERQVVVTRARPAHSIVVALTRSRGGAESSRPAPAAAPKSGNGTLMVDSRPAGAKVFLDGRLIGTTPLLLPEVATGEHAIRMEHDGYRRWAASTKVSAGEQSRVTASLER